MPKDAAFKAPVLADLFQQLRYAPAARRAAHMNAAEALIADIDPQQAYPDEYIVYRITGYRPDTTDSLNAWPGAVLSADLVNFIQRVSASLDLKSASDGRRALSQAQVMSELNVTRKTLQRYRAQGLVFHYVVQDDGSRRLACYDDALRRFVERHANRVRSAAAFSRMTEATQAEIIDAARQLRQRRRLSLNQAAEDLADRFGRSHEAVRGVLQRHDQSSDSPIFDDRGPLDDAAQRLIFRAWRRGVPVQRLMRRFGKGRSTIHRVINRQRAEALRACDLTSLHLPTFDRAEAAEVILAPAVVREGLNDVLPSREALQLLAAAHEADPPREADEHALLAAMNFLKHRAAQRLDALGNGPAAHDLDAIETDLRWATLLMRRLVSLGLPAAVRAVEQNLHRPVAQQSAEDVPVMIRLAVRATAQAVRRLDPTRRQRLERAVAFATDRAFAQLDRPASTARAAARHAAGSLTMENVFAHLGPGPGWLWPAVNPVTEPADEDDALLVAYYGWGGAAPRTLRELADQHRSTPTVVSRRVGAALRRRLTAADGDGRA